MNSATRYALIFDVDGVIADTEPLSMYATKYTFEQLHDLTPTPEDSLAFMGSTAPIFFQGIADRYDLTIDLDRVIALHDELFLGDRSRSVGRLVESDDDNTLATGDFA